mgnify:CR=1 FL=1
MKISKNFENIKNNIVNAQIFTNKKFGGNFVKTLRYFGKKLLYQVAQGERIAANALIKAN